MTPHTQTEHTHHGKGGPETLPYKSEAENGTDETNALSMRLLQIPGIRYEDRDTFF